METIDQYTERKNIWGKLFVTHNDRFGYSILLCVKFASKNWFDRTKFVQMHNEFKDVLDWSSVKDDVIMREFEATNLISAKVIYNTLKKELKKQKVKKV